MDEIQAMLAGTDRGNAEFQGVMPSATNAGGAPAIAEDPAKPQFMRAFQCLSELSNFLFQNGRQEEAKQVGKLAYDVDDIREAAQKAREKAVQASEEAGLMAPNINAMGVPQ